MGDPGPRDLETIGAGGAEPEATVADSGPNGPPGLLGSTLAGEVDPGQPTEGVSHAHETSATGVGDATPTDRTDSSPGRRLAPTVVGYVIEGELGRGAMGVIFRARQVRLNRPCALKVILAGAHADPVAAIRFLGEAEAVAKLQQPNIVHIYSIGEADGLPFLELEYVDGGSLERTIDGTPWPTRRAATLVEALRRFLEDRPIAARRISSAERLLRWGRRNKLVAGLLAQASLGGLEWRDPPVVSLRAVTASIDSRPHGCGNVGSNHPNVRPLRRGAKSGPDRRCPRTRTSVWRSGNIGFPIRSLSVRLPRGRPVLPFGPPEGRGPTRGSVSLEVHGCTN